MNRVKYFFMLAAIVTAVHEAHGDGFESALNCLGCKGDKTNSQTCMACSRPAPWSS